jgi:cell volume regulation protein A
MDLITAFVGMGIIVFIGFLGDYIFERTKIPDVLLLIGAGLLIGPLLTHLLGRPLIYASSLETFAPYLGALALIIILFDGALDLNYDKMMAYLGPAVLHTVVIFAVNVVLVTLLFHYLAGFPFLVAALLGCVVSGTSSAIVIPLLAGSSATEDTKTVLVLESVITDVLCIVCALTLISMLEGGVVDASSVINDLLTPFAVAGMLGGAAGMVWLYFLRWMQGRQYVFMITLAALFVLYGAVEYVKASGAIAVLVFGLVLSNRDEFGRIFRLKTAFVLDKNIQAFHSEVAFVVRTFFFVYTGMIFVFVLPAAIDVGVLPAWIVSSPLAFFTLMMAILIGLFILARSTGSLITAKLKPTTRRDLGVMMVMLPGGLTAAVLAQIPFTGAAYLDPSSGYHLALEPYRAMFVNTVFIVIVACVVITTIGIFAWERARPAGRVNGANAAEQEMGAPKAVPHQSSKPSVQPRPQPKPAAPAAAPQVRSGKPAGYPMPQRTASRDRQMSDDTAPRARLAFTSTVVPPRSQPQNGQKDNVETRRGKPGRPGQ